MKLYNKLGKILIRILLFLPIFIIVLFIIFWVFGLLDKDKPIVLYKGTIQNSFNEIYNIEVEEDRSGWNYKKKIMISDSSSNNIFNYGVGLRDFSEYLPKDFVIITINPTEKIYWVLQNNGDDFIKYINTGSDINISLDCKNPNPYVNANQIAYLKKIINNKQLSILENTDCNLEKWENYINSII